MIFLAFLTTQKYYHAFFLYDETCTRARTMTTKTTERARPMRATEAGETRYIVEKEQTFPDGRVRARTMLVAEKMKAGETWGDCAIRGVDEELGAKVRRQ